MVKKRPDPDRVVRKALPRAPERPAVKQSAGSAKAKKTAARLAAVQVLYQMRLNNQDAASALREYAAHRSGFNLDGDVLVPPDKELMSDIVNGVQSRWGDIENIVTGALAAGKKGEVEPLLESILRAGVYEILAHGDIDTGIIIHDYLSVTAGFYEGPEIKLVNGILDKVAKTVRA
jgi:N utilization substance protein B